ncbi:MAG: isoprenyl transferase [Christensenellaceae bacterium]|nr:isoprenyl transferase [Christensenellaceae bacterium]
MVCFSQNSIRNGRRVLTEQHLPKHIAIIPDGNGRWSKKRNLPRKYVHKIGVDRVREIVSICSKKGIEALTFFAFSTENWKRPNEEVSILMSLLLEVIKNEVPEIHKGNVCLRVIGRKDNLAENIRTAIEEAEELTKNNTGLKLNIAFNYGGRDEILRAVRKLAEQVKNGEVSAEEINEEGFAAALDTAGIPDPDLIIRTSGELRMSNFLLYQAAYSELYFPEVMWPDFGEEEFEKAMTAFSMRNRRFGKV